MAMRQTTIRLSEEQHEFIATEAAREGISLAQYMREAAIARAAYQQGRRAADPGRTILRIIERLRR